MRASFLPLTGDALKIIAARDRRRDLRSKPGPLVLSERTLRRGENRAARIVDEAKVLRLPRGSRSCICGGAGRFDDIPCPRCAS